MSLMTRERWHWLASVVLFVFLIGVAVLLVRYARSVNWRAVGNAIASYEPALFASAIALAALSYTLYPMQDVLGRVYTGHRVPKRRIMAIGMISYAFNLNLGALVGSAGFRYRLYSQSGLNPSTIARIIGFSITTNWFGYIALAGIVFSIRGVSVPPGWSLGVSGLQVIGLLCLVATAAYFVACAVAHDRVWNVRGHEIRLPKVGLAVVQLLVSAANWIVIAMLLYLLLHRQIEFSTVLGVLLVAAIAGAIAHIPAGLGVLELVTFAVLGHRLPDHEILAALLTYRAIYYIGPLLITLVMYLRFEAIAGARLLKEA